MEFFTAVAVRASDPKQRTLALHEKLEILEFLSDYRLLGKEF
jgi:hypothetical protein